MRGLQQLAVFSPAPLSHDPSELGRGGRTQVVQPVVQVKVRLAASQQSAALQFLAARSPVDAELVARYRLLQFAVCFPTLSSQTPVYRPPHPAAVASRLFQLLFHPTVAALVVRHRFAADLPDSVPTAPPCLPAALRRAGMTSTNQAVSGCAPAPDAPAARSHRLCD